MFATKIERSETRRLKLPLRIAIALLVVGCSSKMVETYGCACGSRTYTFEELEGYRRGAIRGDLQSLAEMEQYYGVWKANEAMSAGDVEKQNRFERLAQGFGILRLRGRDPEAIQGKFGGLLYHAAFEAKSPEESLKAIQEAKSWTKLLPPKYETTDLEYDVPGRREMDARL